MCADKWVDWCRKHTRFQVVRDENMEHGKGNDPQQEMESNEAELVMKNALAELPEAQRAVFLMNRYEGLTYGEIADRLDLSEKAIEKRMSQALKHLRKCWSDYENQ